MQQKTYQRKLIIFLVVIMAVFLAIKVYQNSPTNIFSNRALEKIAREQIGKPTGDITPEDCLGIIELDLSAAKIITDIKGVEKFVDLKYFKCSTGWLSDISALQNLTKLERIDLSKNRIRDITPLSNLTNLKEIVLQNNNIRDLSTLSSLTNLEHLVIGENPVENMQDGFAPLLNLSGLRIGAYADYDLTVIEGTLVDSNSLPKGDSDYGVEPEEVEDIEYDIISPTLDK